MSASEGDPAAAGASPEAESIVLTAQVRSSAMARTFVGQAIARSGAPVPEDLLLLTSEATTNATIHADSNQITVSVERIGSVARVSVQDDDPTPPHVVSADPGQPGGLGVRLIDQLAADWGVTQIQGDGKLVWFEVPLAEGDAPDR
ncbi:ATP-binding protein [Aquihabitans sp. G128]|uniref:ATP-binding protein n=1 Tax=Aquihabitans sp. G128 TaxID=2849779 RepID=UPI001C23E6C0|nr:ATP-binding protein [Aquihabitans sp. G128]QXC60884.1 ATP-binding protein [Aquihabitans sp. G128]